MLYKIDDSSDVLLFSFNTLVFPCNTVLREEKRREEKRREEKTPFTLAITVTHSPFKFLLITHSLQRLKKGQVQNRGTEGEEREKMSCEATTPQTNERSQGGREGKTLERK